MEKKRVVAGTLQSINGSLQMLRKYHFTTSVIDEASQILEPHILPLLSAKSDGGNMVDKFVFIGDHKQLPAIVVQPKGNSVVTNPVIVLVLLLWSTDRSILLHLSRLQNFLLVT